MVMAIGQSAAGHSVRFFSLALRGMVGSPR